MPWASNHLPKYRKHRRSGQAVVTISGRDYYLGSHGTKASKLEYDRLITEWLASGRSTSFGTAQHDLTVVELIADYLRYARTYYGTGPTSEYHRMLRILRRVKALYGRTLACDFGVVQFKAVRQSLMGEDLCRGYVNETMRRMVGMFKWGAAEGKIPASVPQALAIIPGLRKGKCGLREADPVVPVDDAIVDATLPCLSGQCWTPSRLVVRSKCMPPSTLTVAVPPVKLPIVIELAALPAEYNCVALSVPPGSTRSVPVPAPPTMTRPSGGLPTPPAPICVFRLPPLRISNVPL